MSLMSYIEPAKRSRSLGYIFAFVLIVVAVSSSVLGQEHSAMSADQTLRSNARVNPSTLGMELSIPLASYPGRGMAASVSLSYSSKIWRMENVGFTPIGNTSICKGLSIPRFAELSASGWTTDAPRIPRLWIF